MLKVNAAVEIDIVPIVTAGDLIANGSSTIDVVGGIKGLFTKEIDSQLLSGNIDIAVHSVKDMSSKIINYNPIFYAIKVNILLIHN